ncbi:hypothetical protein D3C77_391500 [compost metagenome]
MIGRALTECFLFDPGNVGGCRYVSTRRNRTVVAEQLGNHICRSSLVRQTLPEVMTQQHCYLVRLVYPGFSQLVFEAYTDFGYR